MLVPKKLNRLINIFKLSEKSLFNTYTHYVSHHWREFNQKKIINKKKLINFRKEFLSKGFDGHNSDFTFSFFETIKKKVGENFLYNNLLRKNIGNSPYNFKFINYFLDYNQLVLIYWFSQIKKYLFKKKIKIICEIGGGFGQFSELILNNTNAKLIFIDLPLSNLLCSYYLSCNFPKKKFFLYDQYLKKNILTKADLKNFDIFILPPNFLIEKDIKIDFFINMRSMMEMTSACISEYFNFIQNHSRVGTYFFNFNRFHKSIGNETISFCKFPYDKNWDVISSGQSFNQNWIWYNLSERKFKKFKKNILQDLDYVKKIGKKYYISSNFIIKNSRRTLSLLINAILFIFIIFLGKKSFKRVGNRIANFA